MNFLAYKIAEHFGKELLKAVALVAATTAAAEVGMKLVDKLLPQAEESAQPEQETLDLGQLLSQFQPEPAQPPVINVTVNVNSYNEKNQEHGNVHQEGNTSVGGEAELLPEEEE